MSRVCRLAGAIVAETEGQYFLIGNLKRPCDFAAAGFERPPLDGRYVPLQRSGEVNLRGPWLAMGVEGEAVARALADRLLIERNGSVSDRLWRLILSDDPDADEPGEDAVIDARWLGEMPPHVWRVVRDAVLKCV